VAPGRQASAPLTRGPEQEMGRARVGHGRGWAACGGRGEHGWAVERA
jgi:ribosomal protein L15